MGAQQGISISLYHRQLSCRGRIRKVLVVAIAALANVRATFLTYRFAFACPNGLVMETSLGWAYVLGELLFPRRGRHMVHDTDLTDFWAVLTCMYSMNHMTGSRHLLVEVQVHPTRLVVRP